MSKKIVSSLAFAYDAQDIRPPILLEKKKGNPKNPERKKTILQTLYPIGSPHHGTFIEVSIPIRLPPMW